MLSDKVKFLLLFVIAATALLVGLYANVRLNKTEQTPAPVVTQVKVVTPSVSPVVSASPSAAPTIKPKIGDLPTRAQGAVTTKPVN